MSGRSVLLRPDLRAEGKGGGENGCHQNGEHQAAGPMDVQSSRRAEGNGQRRDDPHNQDLTGRQMEEGMATRVEFPPAQCEWQSR